MAAPTDVFRSANIEPSQLITEPHNKPGTDRFIIKKRREVVVKMENLGAVVPIKTWTVISSMPKERREFKKGCIIDQLLIKVQLLF